MATAINVKLILQDDSPKMKRRKTVIRITKRKKQHQVSDGAQGGNLGSKFMKNFMDLANDLRKERVSESSNTSGPGKVTTATKGGAYKKI